MVLRTFFKLRSVLEVTSMLMIHAEDRRIEGERKREPATQSLLAPLRNKRCAFIVVLRRVIIEQRFVFSFSVDDCSLQYADIKLQ